MPYIKPEIREKLDKAIDSLIVVLHMADEPVQDGNVNYAITRLIDDIYNKPSYSIMARGIMTLECAKMEFYRRVMAPYEDKKKDSNGDVYGL